MHSKNKLHKKNTLLLLAVVVLIVVGIFHRQIYSLIGLFYGVTIDRAINLTTKEKESFNIALLGIGGARHDGPDLSDTIIMANINLKQNKMYMFSIPRDLWIPGDKDKVNAIYAKEKKEGSGLSAVSAVLELVTGQKIDYVLVLDFEGFRKLVDHIGGIDVNVTSTLDDYNYPIEGLEDDPCGKTDEEIQSFTATASAESELWDFFPCRYKHIHVEKGVVHMDGQSALEFVRSRHAIGSEGSDYARSRRQQQVIEAIREKVFSLGVILNPVKMIGIYNILSANIDTNIDVEKLDDFIKLADKLKEGEIKSYVFDEGDNIEQYGLLKNPLITEEYRYKWVLIPRKGNGNFSEIQEFVQCTIDGGECLIGQNRIITPTPTINSEN